MLENLDREAIANGILFILAGLLTAIGGKQGLKRLEGDAHAPDGPKTFEIESALVDSREIKKLTGEVTGLALAVTANTKASQGLIEIAQQWMRDHAEEEDRRLERERIARERRIEQLEHDLKEAERKSQEAMRRD